MKGNLFFKHCWCFIKGFLFTCYRTCSRVFWFFCFVLCFVFFVFCFFAMQKMQEMLKKMYTPFLYHPSSELSSARAQSIDNFPYCTCNLTNFISITCSKPEPRELQVCVGHRDAAS